MRLNAVDTKNSISSLIQFNSEYETSLETAFSLDRKMYFEAGKARRIVIKT